ncbi:MAG TPA: methyltransferase domain-containing protein [Burkholderiales bacterium]
MGVADRLRRRLFGRPQGLLGKLGGAIMARVNRGAAERAVALLAPQPGDAVLEIGFGPGVGIEVLVRAASAGRVAGVDPSFEMLEQARSRNAEAIGRGQVDLRLGSVERLPFDDETFDAAMSINSMPMWPDALQGLREICRVLRPGGRVVLGFTRHSGQRRNDVPELLARAGFVEVSVHTGGEREEDFFVLARKA